MRLHVLVIDIYEPSMGFDYPVVRHEFPGRTQAEAIGYFEAHVGTDEFLRACVYEGRFERIDCVAESRFELVDTEEHIPGGLSRGKRPGDFDPVELRVGTEVELEHTSSAPMAREIAMDHLTEDPLYYEKLRRAGL